MELDRDRPALRPDVVASSARETFTMAWQCPQRHAGTLGNIPGSAHVPRAGDRCLAIANFCERKLIKATPVTYSSERARPTVISLTPERFAPGTGSHPNFLEIYTLATSIVSDYFPAFHRSGRVVPLFLESHPEIIGTRLGPSFTHSICVLSAACVAGEISIQEWWSVRRCRDQHVIAVDVDAE